MIDVFLLEWMLINVAELMENFRKFYFEQIN